MPAAVAFHSGAHLSGTQSPFATLSEVPRPGMMGCVPAPHESYNEAQLTEAVLKVRVPGGQGRQADDPAGA